MPQRFLAICCFCCMWTWQAMRHIAHPGLARIALAVMAGKLFHLPVYV